MKDEHIDVMRAKIRDGSLGDILDRSIGAHFPSVSFTAPVGSRINSYFAGGATL
jgi:hypothetical protein